MNEKDGKLGCGPRRWHEQRWLIDIAVRAQSIDWDPSRTAASVHPIGAEALMEVNWVKQRIRKFEDIASAFVPAAENCTANQRRSHQ